jgi:hypothetical protein
MRLVSDTNERWLRALGVGSPAVGASFVHAFRPME